MIVTATATVFRMFTPQSKCSVLLVSSHIVVTRRYRKHQGPRPNDLAFCCRTLSAASASVARARHLSQRGQQQCLVIW